ncbi:MAG: Peptide-methionine (R)-S-oxide reductase MsrB, partial [uncultured Sphingomonas sp.]
WPTCRRVKPNGARNWGRNVTASCGRRALKRRGRANCSATRPRASTAARAAGRPCSRATPNMRAAAAGRASPLRSRAKPSRRSRTRVTACTGWRCAAPGAKAISATSFPTARGRKASVTASTRPASSSSLGASAP